MNKFFPFLIFPMILLARDWTVLVYMAADNSLVQWADSDLVEMENVGSSSTMTVIVQVDKPSIGARRLLIGQGTSQELQDLGVIDMCDWQTLTNFLVWGISRYPAERYFVVLWDHGTGWLPGPRQSFGSDWSSGTTLGIANGDLRRALQTVYNSTGERINLFAFDACLMQQIEVAYEIKGYATVLVAPQTICPLPGFQYDGILEELTTDPSMSSHELAKKVVAINVNRYIDVQPVVFGALNVGYLYYVEEAMDDVITSLMVHPPSQAIIDLRARVQTIPIFGTIPGPGDDYVDLGDFAEGLYTIYPGDATEQLVSMYNNLVIASGYWGDDFSSTTGLTVWFPAQYLRFKQLLDDYGNLIWIRSQWMQFLNWFYAQDDRRPTAVSITADDVRDDNSFHLSWHTSYDLAPLTYHVVEATDTSLLFHDPCEDSSLWNLYGFSLNANNPHSGTYAFFSGNAGNLQNSMETKSTLFIKDLALLSLYLYYNTEDMTDSLIIEYGSFHDVHYGQSLQWQERRVLLPSGDYPLRISYHTNSTTNLGGCFIDDISIFDLSNGRYVRQYYADTSLYIFNKLRGTYYYAVYAQDRYGNTSTVSNTAVVSVENYAVPYSHPNPFQTSCDVVLDYPDTLNPTVEIFSISARRVKKFSANEIYNKTVHWDGKDDEGQEVGSGIYFVLVKDGTFKKIGKIARQR